MSISNEHNQAAELQKKPLDVAPFFGGKEAVCARIVEFITKPSLECPLSEFDASIQIIANDPVATVAGITPSKLLKFLFINNISLDDCLGELKMTEDDIALVKDTMRERAELALR